MLLFKKLLILSVIFMFSNSALADETLDDDTRETRTLVITGSPIQQSFEGTTEQLAEYDNQAIIDAGDLLKYFPGFSAIRAGGHGVDPVLRGMSQTRINLLQQGAFLHGAGPNRMDSPGSYTEPFGWDEIQIIKGVETLIFGAGGPAGTLNFKRYKPELDGKGIGGKLVAVYSPDYYKLGADLAFGNESGYLRLISQIHDQSSYKDGDNHLTPTAFNTQSNTLIAGYVPDEQSEFRLTFMANRGSDALFAGTMMDGPTTDMDALQVMYLDGDQFSNDYSEYQYYNNQAHHIMDNFSLRSQTSAMRMLTDSYSDTEGLKWLKRWQTGDVIWQSSFDWQNIQRHAERYMGMMGIPTTLQSRIWPDNELDIKGLAIEAEYSLSNDNRLKAGFRYDKVHAEANPLEFAESQTLYQSYYAETPFSTDENNISGFARYYVKSSNNLYWLGLSSTVRTADATERYLGAMNSMPMMAWIGNPNIAPERHNQLEMGAKWKFSGGWHELNIYSDSVHDFILRDRARAQQGILAADKATIYRNTDVTIKGFEWALSKHFADSWNLYTNLSYVNASRDDDGVPLYQIPPIEGLVQLSNDLGKLAYWIDLKWAQSQDDVDDSMMTGSALDAGKSDSWVAVDFKLRYELDEYLDNKWQLTFGVNNLFDEAYSYHVSRGNMDPFNPQAVRVNEPGRQFWVSILLEI